MNGNRIAQDAADQKMAAGLTKNASLIGTLLIDGKPHPVADVVQVIAARIAASKAADAARATWQTSVKANRDQRASTRVFMTQVKQALLIMFASSIDTLSDFGLAPRKQRDTPPEVKVQAALKAKATRVARGTKSKKEKAKIKGVVPQAQPAQPAPPAGASPVPGSSPLAPAKPA
jgi:hypothetical protein